MSEGMIERTPEVIAAEIGAIRNQTRQVVLSAALEIGKRLIEAKALLPHGKWGGYLEGLEYSDRTAQNLMRVYEEYGKKQNPQAIADLSYTKAVAMLALDGEQREALMDEKPVADMSTRQLQAEINAIRAEAQERQVTLDRLTEDLSREKSQRECMEQNARDALERASAADAKEKATKAKLESARVQAKNAQVAASSAGAEADRLRERLKDAEDKLREQPKPEKVIETVEVIPAEVDAELERLRRIAAKAPSEKVVRFRAEYERLTEQFEAVLRLVAEMETEDAETAAKYRNAVWKTAMAMAEKVE